MARPNQGPRGPSGAIATIDIGTNTVLLLVAEMGPTGPRVIAERAEITRLGQGVNKTGSLAPEAIERTLAALRSHVAAARAAGATLVRAVGTQALREAANAARFLEPAAEALGGPIEIVTGAREAELSRRAVMESFPALADGAATIMDVGGGSTEFVITEHGRVAFVDSVKLGSVRLTERFVTSDPPSAAEQAAVRAHVATVIAGVPFPAGGQLVGIAGTVTTLAAIAEDVVPYDPDRVHGMRLSIARLREVTERLAGLPLAERQAVRGLEPKRADVIVAGALIVLGAAERAGAAELLVSDRGVRWGLWYELAAAP